MKYPKAQEETLKNRVARDFFGELDCTEIIENIDFTVKQISKGVHPLADNNKGINSLVTYFLWAEAKADITDIGEMLTQFILTISKARTFDKITPPPFLDCFDREKIAFIPYHSIQEIFYQSDFNWKVAPSNKNTREFKQVYELVKNILSVNLLHNQLCHSGVGRNPAETPQNFPLDSRFHGNDGTISIKLTLP